MRQYGTRVARLQARRRRHRRRWTGRAASAALLLLAVLVAGGGARATGCTASAGIWCQSPFAFTDPYTSLSYVNAPATTAAVNTSGSGTVYLPTNPMALALDPTRSVGVLATQTGVQGWAFHGDAMQQAPQFNISGTGYVGAAWLHRNGNLLAAVTPSHLTLFAWQGDGWSQIASLAVSQANSVAPGPPVAGASASVLVGTPAGFEVAAYQSGALAVVSGAGIGGFTGAAGVAATQDGSMVALWTGDALATYAWNGAGYVETPTWEVPAGSSSILSVAWFHDGGGYWVLTANGTLDAYAFDGSYVIQETVLSTVASLPAGPIATGWRQGDVAVMVPGGWNYYDGTPVAVDPARSVAGLALPYYKSSAVLQSTVLDATNSVSEVQVDATVDSLPADTQIAYQVSTDGGGTWTRIPACVNQPASACASDNTGVPTGSQIVYRLLLSTTNPAVTPVVDLTQILEIATTTAAVSQNSLCTVAGTQPCVVLVQ